MRALVIDRFGGREVMELREVPDPVPSDDEVLIEVHAAGVNPVDYKIREGLLRERLPHHFPIILGWDVAGVVKACGRSITQFSVGQRVMSYCRKPVVQHGAYAELVAVKADAVALIPERLSFVDAAAIPLAALTAYQALFEFGKLVSGELVLIHAAAGGVGSFAVQLATSHGATVIGTASASNYRYVKSLGAAQVIDYNTIDFRKPIRALSPSGVELVLDAVGGEALTKSIDILAPSGRVITIVDSPERRALEAEGVPVQWMFVRPDGAQLAQIGQLVVRSKLKVQIARVFPLEQVREAHELLEGRHVAGKLVLRVR